MNVGFVAVPHPNTQNASFSCCFSCTALLCESSSMRLQQQSHFHCTRCGMSPLASDSVCSRREAQRHCSASSTAPTTSTALPVGRGTWKGPLTATVYSLLLLLLLLQEVAVSSCTAPCTVSLCLLSLEKSYSAHRPSLHPSLHLLPYGGGVCSECGQCAVFPLHLLLSLLMEDCS